MSAPASPLKRKLVYQLYHVASDSDDAIWTPIATCWPHKDGKGMNIPIPFIGHEITVKDDAGSIDRHSVGTTSAAASYAGWIVSGPSYQAENNAFILRIVRGEYSCPVR